MGYWSNTQFADWVRGTKILRSGTGQEWASWRANAKEAHPIRYWLAETGLDSLQNFVMYIPRQFDAVLYYCKQRFIRKSNALVASTESIKPGTYADFGYKLLHCSFAGLVDFVEIEKAKRNPDSKKRRSKEHGIEHLKWEMTLGDESPTQSRTAAEILKLYTWWTVERPLRKDPYDESGWNAVSERMYQKYGCFSSTLNDSAELTEAHCKLRMLEEKYENEDTEMLIRLVKLRENLWS